MSVLFTIELRVSYRDNEKYILAQHVVQLAALHAHAQATKLVDDGDKPQVVIHSHDFEHGHRDVPLMELSPENAAERASMSLRFAAALGAGTQATRRRFLRVIPSFLGRAIARDVQI